MMAPFATSGVPEGADSFGCATVLREAAGGLGAAGCAGGNAADTGFFCGCKWASVVFGSAEWEKSQSGFFFSEAASSLCVLQVEPPLVFYGPPEAAPVFGGCE